MKRVYLILLLSILFNACYKEDIDRLYSEQYQLDALITELRKECLEVNNNVELLKSLINGSMIKEVKTFSDAEAGTSGWEIKFTDNTSFRVYHGKDGYKPIIGVARLPSDTDNWYWSLDGEIMKDNAGKPIKANGQDGGLPSISEDGYWVINGNKTSVKAFGSTPKVEISAEGYWVIDGTTTTVKAEGKSAPEPKLSIGSDLINQDILADKENKTIVPEAWYLSIDKEKSWVRISGTTTEASGNCLIASVTESADKNYITIILQDGTSIQVPSWAWAQRMIDAANDRITVLEAIVGNGKYISAVEPLTDAVSGAAEGWHIKYSDGTFSEIYNGTKGKDGEMPQISMVKEENDYFWTVRNEKLLIDGQPVKANGTNGQNAVEPKVQLGEALTGKDNDGKNFEAGIWYLSVNDTDWTRISGLKGEQGYTGDKGDAGDAFFEKAPEVNTAEGYVIFKLLNGPEIKVALYDWVTTKLTEINTTIEGIHTLLNERKYITKVDTIWETQAKQHIKQYKITFSDKTYIEITNSKVGVSQVGSDLFWTINGEFLEYAGKRIKANAVDGGNVPILKSGAELPAGTPLPGNESIIPTAYYLSVDGGLMWTRVSGDKGDQGPTGAPGKDGENPIFSKVETDAGGLFVTFTFKDGTTPLVIPTQKWTETIKAELNNLKDRIIVIEDLINDGLIIKKIEDIIKNGKRIGYKLICLQNKTEKTFEILNGEDGITPDISVTEKDGDYYWTVNGTTIKDKDGNDIRVNGKDGATGSAGADAPAPVVKDGASLIAKGIITDNKNQAIEDIAFYLSVDKEATWIKITGPEGKPGSEGGKGDALFKEIDTKSDPDFVKFILNDGSVIEVPNKKWKDEVDKRLNDLEQTIAALKALVDQGMIIKSITAFTEGNKTGWNLVCLKNEKEEIYKIYNGTDGKVPDISIADGGDGNFYWTLEGDFIKDDKGNKVQANGIPGNDGTDGTGGTPGQDGKDAPTPQLKIGSELTTTGVVKDSQGEAVDATAFYLSVDNGTSWSKVSGPKGDKGDPGNDNTPLIKDVDASDNDYVTFTLKDGTTFKVTKFKQITVKFESTEPFYKIRRSATEVINFSIEGTGSDNLTLTTIVGGNWKSIQSYDATTHKGTLTIQAPAAWDYNKIVMLLADQKGKVWTSSLTVETMWESNDPFVDRRDERIYTTYLYGTQYWMTQDLKHEHLDGYVWNEIKETTDAEGKNGTCPKGWRIPTNEDWEKLQNNSSFGAPQTGGGWWSLTPLAEGKVYFWTLGGSSFGKELVDPSVKRGVRCIKKDGYDLTTN